MTRKILATVGILIVLVLASFFILKTYQGEGELTITIVDEEGVIVDTEKIRFYKKTKLTGLLVDRFDAKIIRSTYGSYITDIGDLSEHGNYSFMIYIDGSLATTGIDGIALKDGSTYLIKLVDWTTLEWE